MANGLWLLLLFPFCWSARCFDAESFSLGPFFTATLQEKKGNSCRVLLEKVGKEKNKQFWAQLSVFEEKIDEGCQMSVDKSLVVCHCNTNYCNVVELAVEFFIQGNPLIEKHLRPELARLADRTHRPWFHWLAYCCLLPVIFLTSLYAIRMVVYYQTMAQKIRGLEEKLKG